MRRIWVVMVAVMVGATVLAACGSSSSKSSDGAAATTVAAKAKTVRDDQGNQSAGDPALAAYTPTGTIVADNGFTPTDNGFPFQNYGGTLADGAGPRRA